MHTGDLVFCYRDMHGEVLLSRQALDPVRYEPAPGQGWQENKQEQISIFSGTLLTSSDYYTP